MTLVQIRLSGSRLSQANTPLIVVVVDPRGTPFSGAQVTLQGQAIPQKTDSDGVATFPSAPLGEAVVQVQVGQFTIRSKGQSDQALFVTVPVLAPAPLFTVAELVAIVLGGAATLGGVFGRRRALETAGEVLVGAAVFSLVSRHSCRW